MTWHECPACGGDPVWEEMIGYEPSLYGYTTREHVCDVCAGSGTVDDARMAEWLDDHAEADNDVRPEVPDDAR